MKEIAMTSNRLEIIRTWVKDSEKYVAGHELYTGKMKELLEEVDDLRGENRVLASEIGELMPHPDSIIGSLKKQRDDLKEQNKQLLININELNSQLVKHFT